jgi:DNA-binding transcriptional regulator YhcF (GntR family)
VTKVAVGTGVTAFGTAELARLLADWRGTRPSLVDSLAEALIDLIEAAVVPAGVRLPTQRALATAIGVSRGTVTTAYQVLIERGYAQARERSRTWVQQRSQWQIRPGATAGWHTDHDSVREVNPYGFGPLAGPHGSIRIACLTTSRMPRPT